MPNIGDPCSQPDGVSLHTLVARVVTAHSLFMMRTLINAVCTQGWTFRQPANAKKTVTSRHVVRCARPPVRVSFKLPAGVRFCGDVRSSTCGNMTSVDNITSGSSCSSPAPLDRTDSEQGTSPTANNARMTSPQSPSLRDVCLLDVKLNCRMLSDDDVNSNNLHEASGHSSKDSSGNHDDSCTCHVPVNVSGDVNVLFSYHEDRAPGTRVQFGHDIGGTGEGLGQLQDATDVQCLPHANILVTDLVNSRLQVYSSEGNPLFSVNPDQIIETVGKCHFLSHKVCVFSPAGTFITNLRGRGVTFHQPRYVTVSRVGDVIVSDSGNHRLMVFDSDWKFRQSVGGYGKKDGCLKFPHAVCSDSYGNILVADRYNDRVSVFTRHGQFVRHLLTSAHEVRHPQGLALSSQHRLYVTHGGLKASKVILFDLVSDTNNGSVDSGGGLTHTVISVEPNDPRVKVFHGGSWGYICANNWDSLDAHVICRMLGYWHGRGTADLRALDSGQTIWLSNMMCTGSESDISECRFQGWEQQSCPVGAVGAVNCDVTVQTRVRLSDGFGPWEGRVEVERDGAWRPICQTGFGDLDAQVVCRMLGIRSIGGRAHNEQKYGQGTLPPVVRQLDCTGAESDLSQCKGSPALEGAQCNSAGVECYSCGALYATETGTVESEDYPLSYPRNLNCLYVIRPANDQLLYKLEFNSTFSTEECCDKLEVNVLSGKSNVPTGGVTYAGDVGPTRLLGKAFALNFVTDGSNSGEGFQAHWSPASVQDVAIIQCGSGHFTVSIDLNFLQRLYPASTQSTISLADPACTGSVTSINGSDSLVITSETDACEIEYSNFLVDRVFAESSSVIVRDRRWEIPIHCSVARTDKFEVHYNPFPDVGKRHLPQQDESSAHGRTRREVRGQISKSLDFPITMTGYQDKTFSALASVPLHRRLKEEIDLRVQLEGGDSDLKLVLQNCYTRPLPTSDVTYTIIKSGCAVDANTEIIDTQPHNTDFRFTAFEFAGDYPHVYLECDVRVCAANENSAPCTQQCVASQAPVVGRRGVSASFITRNPALYRITFPPIVIDKQHTSGIHHSTSLYIQAAYFRDSPQYQPLHTGSILQGFTTVPASTYRQHTSWIHHSTSLYIQAAYFRDSPQYQPLHTGSILHGFTTVPASTYRQHTSGIHHSTSLYIQAAYFRDSPQYQPLHTGSILQGFTTVPASTYRQHTSGIHHSTSLYIQAAYFRDSPQYQPLHTGSILQGFTTVPASTYRQHTSGIHHSTSLYLQAAYFRDSPQYQPLHTGSILQGFTTVPASTYRQHTSGIHHSTSLYIQAAYFRDSPQYQPLHTGSILQGFTTVPASTYRQHTSGIHHSTSLYIQAAYFRDSPQYQPLHTGSILQGFTTVPASTYRQHTSGIHHSTSLYIQAAYFRDSPQYQPLHTGSILQGFTTVPASTYRQHTSGIHHSTSLYIQAAYFRDSPQYQVRRTICHGEATVFHKGHYNFTARAAVFHKGQHNCTARAAVFHKGQHNCTARAAVFHKGQHNCTARAAVFHKGQHNCTARAAVFHKGQHNCTARAAVFHKGQHNCTARAAVFHKGQHNCTARAAVFHKGQHNCTARAAVFHKGQHNCTARAAVFHKGQHNCTARAAVFHKGQHNCTARAAVFHKGQHNCTARAAVFHKGQHNCTARAAVFHKGQHNCTARAAVFHKGQHNCTARAAVFHKGQHNCTARAAVFHKGQHNCTARAAVFHKGQHNCTARAPVFHKGQHNCTARAAVFHKGQHNCTARAAVFHKGQHNCTARAPVFHKGQHNCTARAPVFHKGQYNCTARAPVFHKGQYNCTARAPVFHKGQYNCTARAPVFHKGQYNCTARAPVFHKGQHNCTARAAVFHKGQHNCTARAAVFHKGQHNCTARAAVFHKGQHNFTARAAVFHKGQHNFTARATVFHKGQHNFTALATVFHKGQHNFTARAAVFHKGQYNCTARAAVFHKGQHNFTARATVFHKGQHNFTARAAVFHKGQHNFTARATVLQNKGKNCLTPDAGTVRHNTVATK
ncbi:hypothetical protein BaRGS_00026580 [Batillaria attramentaria]|uniref:Scavenger receptor cysteine-rich domain-containing protein DMBT1 n=1 Tax=Batillaria attramentaria TaxID=370345 RepID=A0ABD0K5C0_9CAEN